ncbi:MAG: phosphate--acyl-ACP acyltransferase, partial [Acidobacteria bacterium]
FSDAADVVVCDGFTGNIALKVSEGLAEMIADMLRERRGDADGPALGSFARRIDWSEYGGVPLLGVAGLALVGHGRSSARAVRNGIEMAYRHAAAGIISRIQHALEPPGAPKT